MSLSELLWHNQFERFQLGLPHPDPGGGGFVRTQRTPPLDPPLHVFLLWLLTCLPNFAASCSWKHYHEKLVGQVAGVSLKPIWRCILPRCWLKAIFDNRQFCFVNLVSSTFHILYKNTWRAQNSVKSNVVSSMKWMQSVMLDQHDQYCALAKQASHSAGARLYIYIDSVVR